MAIIEGVGDEVTIFLIASTTVISVVLLYFYTNFSSEVFSSWAQHEISVEQQQELSSQTCNDTTTIIQNVQSHQSIESTSSEYESVQDIDNCGTHVNISPLDRSDLPPENETQPLKVQCNNEKPTLEEHNDHATLRQRRLEFFSKSESSGNANELHKDTLDKRDDSINNTEPSEEHLFAAGSTSHNEGDAVTSNEEEPMDNDVIRVRLKYLNETEKLVHSKVEEKVGEFKRKNFSEDLANNKVVRLIFNGQLLQAEERTLTSYGISDNCVIHVHISQTYVQPQPQPSDDDDLDLSNFLWPLLAIILIIVWFLHFQYRELFNIASTVVLLGLTIFFAAVWGQTGLRGRTARLPQS